MTIAKTNVSKLVVAFVAFTLLFSAAFAPVAKAQTSAELQAQITALLAQIAQLQSQLGGSSSTSCSATFTRDLGQGATGADVMALQKFLNTDPETRLGVSGAGSAGMETSYYGPATAAAVSKFQVKYRAEVLTPLGLVNPTGYFGASSRAKANALCATGTPGTGTGTGSSALEGGAGSIDEAKFLGGINNEEVGEGEEDVEVLGLGVKPENSDIEIAALKVTFDRAQGTDVSGSATRFDRYADEVSIWLDGEEVARIDADEFTKDATGIYSKTITLDRGAIVRDGDTDDLVVAVSAVSNLDSGDVTEEWGVRVDNIRFRDAQGAIITDSSTADLGTYRIFSFEDFATSADLEFKVRTGDTSVNTAQTIEVSSTTKKNNVAVLNFTVEVEGDSDMNIDELTVDATTTNALLNSVIATAYLYVDGENVGSESITSAMATAAEIAFDDLDLDLDAGETYEFEVRVDFQKATGAFVTGTTLDVDVSSGDISSTTKWVIEDENGDTVATGDRSGSGSADAHTLVTEGVLVKLTDSSAVQVTDANSTAANYGKFTMEVELTAVGDDIYVLETAASSSVALTSSGLQYIFETSAGQAATASTTSGTFTHKSGGTVDGSSIRISEGQTATFEFVGTFDPTTGGQHRARVVGVGFGTTNSGTGSSQTASPASDYRTGYTFISN